MDNQKQTILFFDKEKGWVLDTFEIDLHESAEKLLQSKNKTTENNARLEA